MYKIQISSVITALNESSAINASIYPNPSNSSFRMELKENSDVELYTLQGKLLSSYHNVAKLEFGSELEAGVYLVKTGSSVYKIVKE